MLCILTIRLLLAYSFGSDLGGIANPQLEVQFRQHSLEPARMPTGFYPHTHFHSWCCEVTVELFRFLRVLQSPLSKFSSVGIHKRNLLEARVVVTSYNDHLRLLSPEPVGGFSTTNFTRASEPTLSWNHFTQYKKAPTFAVGCDCTHHQPSEKERLYESRKVYRHGRSSGHHLRRRDGCWWQADHGRLVGDQSSHDCRVRPRITWPAVAHLRGRNFGCLVARSAETPGRPTGGL